MFRKIWACVMMLFTLACKREEQVILLIKDFNGKGWTLHDTIMWVANFPDTFSAYNMYYYLRMRADYPYYNFYLFLWHKRYGDTLWMKDTVELILADKMGNWLGSVKNNIVENKILFRRNFRPSTTNKYVIKVVHGLRMDTVKEVIAFGVIGTRVVN